MSAGRCRRAPRVQQRLDVVRHRRLDVDPRARHRMRERDAPRVERLTRKCAQRRGEQRIVDLRPSRLAVRRDRRPAASRAPRGGRGSDACARSPAGSGAATARRAARRRAPAARIASGSPRRPSPTRRPCGDRRDRAEPQVDLAARDVHAAVDDGQVVLFASFAAIARCSAACAAAVLATTTMPEVSLSRRLTSDGRCGAGQRARVPQQRVHQRRRRVLVGRVHDETGRLVDREQVSSSYSTSRPTSSAAITARGVSSGSSDRDDVAERGARGDAADRRAVHGDQPVLDPRLHARARRAAESVRCRRSTRSRRSPASPRSAVRTRGGGHASIVARLGTRHMIAS